MKIAIFVGVYVTMMAVAVIAADRISFALALSSNAQLLLGACAGFAAMYIALPISFALVDRYVGDSR